MTAADPGASNRQVHVIDRDGRTAAFTGTDCVDWCGSVSAPLVSVAGNMLAGPQVVEATLASYLANAALDFDDRLIAALEAGRPSAATSAASSRPPSAFGSESYPAIDIRVDDHAEPLVELRRLWRIAHQRYVPFQAAGPSRANPGGVLDRAELDRRCAAYAADWNARHPAG